MAALDSGMAVIALDLKGRAWLEVEGGLDEREVHSLVEVARLGAESGRTDSEDMLAVARSVSRGGSTMNRDAVIVFRDNNLALLIR